MELAKRVISAVAGVSVLFSIVSPITGVNAAMYTEIEAANKLATMGVIVDQSSNPSAYRMGDEITRREMIKIAMNIRGGTVPDKCEGKFVDLPATDWGCKYAEAALSAGLIAANEKFNPAINVSKIEALKMVMNARGIKKYETTDWRKGYVDAAVDAGVLADAVDAGVIATAFSDYDAKAKRGWIFVISVNTKDVVDDPEDPDLCTLMCTLDDSCAECDGYCDKNPTYAGCIDTPEEACTVNPNQDKCGCAEYPAKDGCTNTETCSANPNQDVCTCEDYPEKDGCDVVVADGDLVVTLAPDTPLGATIPGGISGLPTVKYNFTAGAEDATITSITVKRLGISDDETLTALAAFSENGRISKDKNDNQGTNSDEAQLTLIGGFTVPAGETRSITVVVSVARIADKSMVEADEFKLQLIDVVAGGEATMSGDLTGNKMTVGSRDAALIEVKSDANVPDVTVGEKDVDIFKFKVNGANEEDTKLTSITFKASDSDAVVNFENIRLVHEGTEVATGKISGKYITFDLGTGITIPENGSEKFTAIADVVGGAGDTYEFYVDKELDVRGIGQKYGYGLSVDITDAEAGDLGDITIKAGELSLIDIDAEHDKIRADKEDVELGSVKVINLAGQNLELQKYGVKVEMVTTSPTLKLQDVLANVELYNETTGEIYELDEFNGTSTIGYYYNDDMDTVLPEGEMVLMMRADTLVGVPALTELKLSLAIDGVTSTGEFYAEETDEDNQVTDITPSSLSWKKLVFIDSGATVANIPLADTTVVRGTKGELAMTFEVKAEEASDINIDQILARLTIQRKMLTASAVGSVAASLQTDLTVTKVPAVTGGETYEIRKDGVNIIADYTTVAGDTIPVITNDLLADLVAKGYTASLIPGPVPVAQEDVVDSLAGDFTDQYQVVVNGTPYTVPFNTNIATTYADLAAAINADPFAVVTATPTATDITIKADTAGTPFTSSATAVDGINVVATYTNTPTTANTQAVKATATAGYVGIEDAGYTGVNDINAEDANGTIGAPIPADLGTEIEVIIAPMVVDQNAADNSSIVIGVDPDNTITVTVANDDADYATAQSAGLNGSTVTAVTAGAAANGINVVITDDNTTDCTTLVGLAGVSPNYTITCDLDGSVAGPGLTAATQTFLINTAVDLNAVLKGAPGALVVADTITLAGGYDEVIKQRSDVIAAINLDATASALVNAALVGVDSAAVAVAETALAGGVNAVKQVNDLTALAGDLADSYTVSIDPDGAGILPAVITNVPFNTNLATTAADIAADINATLAGSAVVAGSDIKVTAPVAGTPFTLIVTPVEGVYVLADINIYNNVANVVGTDFIRVISPDTLSFPAGQGSRNATVLGGNYFATLTATVDPAPAGFVYGVELNGVNYVTPVGGTVAQLTALINAIPGITAVQAGLNINISSATAFTLNNGPTTAMASAVPATNKEIAKVSLYAGSASGTLLDQKSGTDIAFDGTVEFDVNEDILADNKNTYVITIDVVDGADAVANTPIIVDLVGMSAEDDDNDTVKVVLAGTTLELAKTTTATTSPLESEKETTVTESGILIVNADANNTDNKEAKSILGGTSVIIYSADILAQNESVDVETVRFVIPGDLKKALQNASIYLDSTMVATNSSSDITYDPIADETTIAFDNLTGLIIPEEPKEIKLAVNASTIGYEKVGEIISSAAVSEVYFTNVEGTESGKDVADKSLLATMSNTFSITPALITSSVVTQFGSESDLKLTVDAGANTKATDNTKAAVKIDTLTFNQVGTDKGVATFSIKDSNGNLIDTKTAVGVASIVFNMGGFDISDNETFTISIDSGTTAGNSYGLDLKKDGVEYRTSSNNYDPTTPIFSNYKDEVELGEYNAS